MDRTTIRLSPQIKRQAVQFAAETGRTFTSVVEEALVRMLSTMARPSRRRAVRLPTASLGPPNVPVERLNRPNELLLEMDIQDMQRVSHDLARRTVRRKRP